MPARNIVVAALPDQLHYEVVIAALHDDQHVLVVKSLALTHDQARSRSPGKHTRAASSCGSRLRNSDRSLGFRTLKDARNPLIT